MKNQYKYEIGIHFKENVTLKQKQSIFWNMADYIEDIETEKFI